MPRWQRAFLLAGFLVVLAGTTVFAYLYLHFSHLIDERMSGEVFNHASMVFSAPTPVSVGQPWTPERVASRLRKALYSEGEGAAGFGSYRVRGDRLEIRPGPASFFEGGPIREGPAVLEFHEGKLASISSLEDGSSLEGYWLEPEVITTLFDQSRAKRRLVRYDDLPQDCVDAVLAAEDHRFFSHHGVSLYRILGAAVADIRADERAQGGSTLTMQLARTFFLSRRKTLSRKLEEIFLALLMEQRLSKRQIFELYANQTYLGQRGSFSVYGFGEAADAYFNKDVKSLTLPEAALLAALIRGPNLYSPYKNPKRAIERRNWVLHRMSEDGLVSAADAERASKAPLQLAQQNLEGSQAPFFVDMVKDQLLAQFPERDLVSQSFRIYTTLDLDLQRAASDAVRAGMTEVDRELAKKKRPKGAPPSEPNQPQVALVTLDPHTGELKAFVGGRDYGVSQLDHVLARRPPGSSFKPFVYAAALNSGVDGSQPVITPATILMDEPTTFTYEGGTYDPGNYKQEYHGAVTVREALNQSLNVATVRLAEMVGYDRIRKLAIEAGMNKDLLATPALALGAYVATPLEIAGAYTVFANDGQYVGPRFILAVNDTSGRNLLETSETRRQVLDSRVSYLMVNLMESVINNGTAAGVRSRGFTLPAAGKTGTSHDGWFAGFTSNLLAVVWVGYDDDRDLRLTGGASALPVWTEFMKRATQIPAYQKVEDFTPPPGVVTVELPASPGVPGEAPRQEVFIEGTEPRSPTVLEGVSHGISGLFRRIFGGSSPAPGAASPASAPATRPGGASQPSPARPGDTTNNNPPESRPQKKGGALKKIFSIFKGRPKPAPPAPEKQ